ncbi:hypothetical protein I2I05_18995 [Hymenobacter sp. BT683]|uniref:HEPN domain-containing protein n=1 Tax=Hymenobacter jeongseonensis TaxID=2791027 RepID=A0ABS0IMB5_9BACT|nr:hypothetical protein [Hymenobacter jeongseonensis]MBF9239488.1 hypothetical protein [Hymenobacter jeongseonensis]
MEAINVYTSNATDQGLVAFTLALGMNLGRQINLRPLSQLPKPDPLRRQALRVERVEVLEQLKQAEFCLEQYACGAWQPDASHQEGTRFIVDSLTSRLRGLDAVLSTEKGGGSCE